MFSTETYISHAQSYAVHIQPVSYMFWTYTLINLIVCNSHTNHISKTYMTNYIYDSPVTYTGYVYLHICRSLYMEKFVYVKVIDVLTYM